MLWLTPALRRDACTVSRWSAHVSFRRLYEFQRLQLDNLSLFIDHTNRKTALNTWRRLRALSKHFLLAFPKISFLIGHKVPTNRMRRHQTARHLNTFARSEIQQFTFIFYIKSGLISPVDFSVTKSAITRGTTQILRSLAHENVIRSTKKIEY